MRTSCLENGSSNYQCTVNKGLILPQYMLLLCPCPHSMVKRASEQTHKSFCSIFSHVECICQGPEVKRRKRKKKRKKKEKKNRIGVCSGLMAFGHFWEKGLWSGSLEGGKWKCFRQYSACKSHIKTFFVALAFSEMESFLILQSS